MKQFVSTKKRFIQSLEYQINKNEEMIRLGIKGILEKENVEWKFHEYFSDVPEDRGMDVLQLEKCNKSSHSN